MERQTGIRELASGIDALYLSGRASLPGRFLGILEDARRQAEADGGGADVTLGAEAFSVLPRSWGKYRYCLRHRNGLFGVSPSEKLPALRIQPVAEFLHGVGPAESVAWIREVLGSVVGPVLLSASRMDLHSDWQGWLPSWEDRERFVGHSKALAIRAEGSDVTGWEFGRRQTGTVLARIYDKTREIASKGSDYWPEIWGEAYDRESPVIRVEFEFGRQGLREYGVDTAEEAIEAAGALWASVTQTWLTLRMPTADGTRSRWPVAPEWECVQRASLRQGAPGRDRLQEAATEGGLRRLMPALVGYLARLAVLTGTNDLPSTMATAHRVVERYGDWSGLPFADRIVEKRREMAL